jgi:hypothetical protein
MIDPDDEDGSGRMTSGQGGAGGHDQGRERPPYPPPGPYGAPGPHGPPGSPWQHPPGYGPAPSARTGPPPEPRERPLPVRAGLGAFIAWTVLGLASFVLAFAHWDEFSAGVLSQPSFQDEQLRESGIDPAAFVDTLGTLFLVVGLLYTALLLMFIWFAWRGYGWARVVLWVLGGIALVFGLAGLGAGSSPFPFLSGLSFFQVLVLTVGVVLLAGRPATEWFRSEKERRAWR